MPGPLDDVTSRGPLPSRPGRPIRGEPKGPASKSEALDAVRAAQSGASAFTAGGSTEPGKQPPGSLRNVFDVAPPEPPAANAVREPSAPPSARVRKLSPLEEWFVAEEILRYKIGEQLLGAGDYVRQHPADAALRFGLGVVATATPIAIVASAVQTAPGQYQVTLSTEPVSSAQGTPDVLPHIVKAPTPTPTPTPPPAPLLVTPKQLREIMPHLSAEKSVVWAHALSQAMERFGITTPNQKAAFLAEIAWESGELEFQREINPPPRFGIYYGRGPFQLTWESNYLSVGEQLGLGRLLVVQPDLVATDPALGADTAGVFWVDHDLSQALDSGGLYLVTYRINGGESGEAGRLQYYETAKRVFGA